MKRCFWALILALSLLLSACSVSPAVDTTVTIPTTEAVWSPYAGTLKGYVYCYEGGRELQWEEDILYVAEVFLGGKFIYGHPLLTDSEYQTFFAMDSKPVENRSFYDAALREEFIKDINNLILLIPQLDDTQLLLALQRTVAKLHDLHSYIYPPIDTVYPIFFTAFFTDAGTEYSPVLISQKQEHVLFTRLVAVNDIPVQEVVRRLLVYASCENDYAAAENVSYYLSSAAHLEAAGIAKKGQTVRFRIETDRGTAVEVSLAPMKASRLQGDNLSGYTMFSIRDKDTDRSYWWEYLEKERVLYIRFNRIEEDYDLSYSSFTKQLRQQLQRHPQTKAVVIDLRGNPGGYFHANLAVDLGSLLSRLDGQKSYVLIDNASYSAAIILAGSLRQMSENTLLVGTHGGQPANFFASVHTYTMPNSGHEFAMSDFFWVTDETDTGDALMPDVLIHQTREDFEKGYDTALEAVLSGKLRAK